MHLFFGRLEVRDHCLYPNSIKCTTAFKRNPADKMQQENHLQIKYKCGCLLDDLFEDCMRLFAVLGKLQYTQVLPDLK